MQNRSATAAALGMIFPSGFSLVILEAAVCFDGMGWYLRSHKSSLIENVCGLYPATMSREKATMWPLSAVLLA